MFWSTVTGLEFWKSWDLVAYGLRSWLVGEERDSSMPEKIAMGGMGNGVIALDISRSVIA